MGVGMSSSSKVYWYSIYIHAGKCSCDNDCVSHHNCCDQCGKEHKDLAIAKSNLSHNYRFLLL